MNNEIRYYKGKIKLHKILKKGDSMQKCAYMALDSGEGLEEGSTYIIPWRLCWRRPKNV